MSKTLYAALNAGGASLIKGFLQQHPSHKLGNYIFSEKMGPLAYAGIILIFIGILLLSAGRS